MTSGLTNSKKYSRIVALVISSLFLFTAQDVNAVEIKEIDISSAGTCPVSLKDIWSQYGVPHPCFTDGSALKIKIPKLKSSNDSVKAYVNGEEFSTDFPDFFSIPNYRQGLNEIVFKSGNQENGFNLEVSTTKFIVYKSPQSRLRSLSEPKKSYVLTFAEGVFTSDAIAALGIAQNEYYAQTISGASASEAAQVIVADLSVNQFTFASTSPLVERVFPEEVLRNSATQSGATWGLDRIDQLSKNGNGTYQYGYDGAGVNVYIIDTGINTNHTEFTNRITDAWYLTPLGTVEDCDGHGTHVASIAAGTTYGVAKAANIIPMKALNCAGEGTLSGIITMINKIIELHGPSTPAVANLSLGDVFNSTMNSYIQALINDGVVTVVAAGNESDDSCLYSPASAPNAITVGSSTSVDQDSSFSNIGACVDIFAPGSGILAAGIGSNTATQTLNGTSMASPFVAGAAALVMQKDFSSYGNKLNANAFVRESLVSNAIPNALSDSTNQNLWWSNTTNRLLNVSFLTLQAQSTLQITNTNLGLVVGSPTTLTTSGGSGSGAVSFRSFGLNCQISGNTLTIAVSQTCYVLAFKAEDASYSFSTSSVVTFTAGQVQAPLTITNSNTNSSVATPILLTTSGGTGSGALTFSVVSGPCKVINSKLVGYAEGRCLVTATKEADATYAAITSAALAFNIGEVLSNGPWKQVSTGGGTTCAITKTSGSLYCWGHNYYGQIGKPSTYSDSNPTPQLVTGIPGQVTDVSVGSTFACAVNSLSNLYCWGNNQSGQLGNNSLIDSSAPETVTTLSGNAKSVSLGNFFACATTVDNKAYCWGLGSNGRLGNGSTTNFKIPTLVSGMSSGVSQVSAGADHACAIQSGAVKCWGYGFFGSLGNGAATTSETPVNVTGLSSGFTKVVSGSRYSCAMNATNAYCWGDNSEGALGNGTTVQSNSPIALAESVSALSDISAGYGNTCVVTRAGGVICWGYNSSWQIGNDSPTNVRQLLPAKVLGLDRNISSIEVADDFACAVAKYGRMFCWGSNSWGALGTGDSTRSPIAIQSSQLDYNLNPAITPEFSTSSIVRRLNGFQVEISNFDSSFSWNVASSSVSATVTVSPTGVVNVSGLGAGVSSTLMATVGRVGYETGTATSSAISTLSLGRTPAFDTNTATSRSDGFRINLSNHDSNYQWVGVSSRESATVTISDTGTVTVSGITPGTSSTVTITSSRSGYSSESATSLSYSSLTGFGLIPIIDSTTAVATADGFTVNISNYDPLYSWSGTSTVNGGSVSISNTGRITMTGITADTPSRAVVTTSRTGYFSRSETSTAITSLKAGLITTFDTRTPTADGFTIAISNINNLYSYSATSNFNGGLAVVDTSTGIVTVTNITTGTPSRVTVTTNRSGYASVSVLSETVTSIPSAVATLSALTINGTNVLPPNSSVTVGHGVTSVSPVVTPTNAFATWVIESATGLVTGSNMILITVTSQNGLNRETYTATVIVSNPPPPPAPAPAPAGGGGGGGVGTTWFNLFISNPDDSTLAYSGEACAIFILKAEDGDKTSPTICATKAGALDYEANDGNYLVRTFDKATPKNFKEYKAKVTFGTFEVTGAGYRGGSVPRRVITVLKPSEFPVEPVVVPSPTPTPTPTPTPSASPTPSAADLAEPTPTATALPTISLASNGVVKTVAKTSTTKKVSVAAATTNLTLKKNGAVTLSVGKVPANSAISVVVTLPSGEKFTAASIKSYNKGSYSMPALAFSKSGNYVVTIKIGKSSKMVKIKVS